jgi:type III secretion system YscJ/HrcJ family lipoprotein
MLAAIGPACARETVAHQQSEADSNRMLVLLENEGIDAVKIKDEESRELAFNVQVPQEDKSRAYELLVKHNLPETKHKGTTEIYGEGDVMIPTAEQERAKLQAAIKGDIINSLRRVPRVIEATAMVSIPEDNPLRDVNEAKPKPKASVIISYLPDDKNLPPIAVEDVQRYVQAGLPELRSAEVSVQLIPMGSRMMSGNGSSPSGVAMPALANGCEKVKVMGLDICTHHQKRLFNGLISVVVVVGIAAVMAVLAVLRALRYRRDLTRLTAQVAQLKK